MELVLTMINMRRERKDRYWQCVCGLILRNADLALFFKDTARFEYMIGWERQAFQLGSCAYGTVRAVDRAKVA